MTAAADDPPFTAQALMRPAAFPHPVDDLRIAETHLSWVILTGEYAYKVKKPVTLPFVDCSALEQRRALCEEELRLNRRLAPEIYEAVVPIIRERGGFRIGGAGPAVEYAVRMREFDRRDELHERLADGRIEAADLTAFAETLAAFHEHAPVARPTPGNEYAKRLRSAVLGNLATLVSAWRPEIDVPDLGRLIDWVHDALHAAGPRLQRREDAGRIRECHGDLHARNLVFWKGRLTAFDCLEFDPALRWIDVLDDTAFLFMDLLSHQRPDLAFEFLQRYLEQSGDHVGLDLVPLYAVHRALVRAMVDALQPVREGADTRERLGRRIAAAKSLIERPAPRLILMHGTSGSGKTWLSRQLVARVHAIRLCSDLERRRLGAGADRYTPESRRAIYSRLETAAASCLEGRFDTIVDATFLTRADRQPFLKLAARFDADCVIVSCAAPWDVQQRRIHARLAAGNDPSEADARVLEQQWRSVEPVIEAEGDRCVSVDTTTGDAAQRAAKEIENCVRSSSRQ